MVGYSRRVQAGLVSFYSRLLRQTATSGEIHINFEEGCNNHAKALFPRKSRSTPGCVSHFWQGATLRMGATRRSVGFQLEELQATAIFPPTPADFFLNSSG